MKKPVKGPNRKANAMGLDRTKLAEAKSSAALKSMSDRLDNPKGKNAGLTLSQALSRRGKELDLFRGAEKLYSERDRAKALGKNSASIAAAKSGASRSVAGKVKPNPNKSKTTYLKGKK